MKVKFNKNEIIQLVIYSILCLLSVGIFILGTFHMEPSEYYVPEYQFFYSIPKYLSLVGVAMFVVSLCLMFIPLSAREKRKQQQAEEAYLRYLSTLTEQELQIEQIRLQKEQNESLKLAIFAAFMNRRF